MKKRHKKLIVIALAAAVIIAALVTSYFYLAAEKGAPSYSAGNRWTWQVTRQELDPPDRQHHFDSHLFTND